MFTDALSYPIRNSGWIMILIGAVFSVILDVLQRAPLLGFAVGIFGAGYFGAFYLDIIGSTMTGRDEIPDWPSFSGMWDDIVAPFLRLCGLVIISFCPVIAVAAVAPQDALWFWAAILGAIIWGCIYFPMAVLAVQAFGGIGAAFPHRVLPAIWRAMPGYSLAVLALMAGFLASGFAQALTSQTPYVGWLLASSEGFYSLMFQARLIGLIYRAKQHRLGWD